MEHIKAYKVTDNCQIDADAKESLVQHLEDHGVMSLLTSSKFAPYFSCVVKEIGKAIAAESALIASAAADDSIGNQDAAASPADGTAESPAALFGGGRAWRRRTSYRQGRG